MVQLTKIISGGQVGVDIAALRAAKEVGLETGGSMPRGFITKGGLHPEYASFYNVIETTTDYYAQRTAANVFDSDATLRIAQNFGSAGERCTLKYIKQYSKPSLDVDFANLQGGDIRVAETVIEWISRNNISVLNVAGNANKSMETSTQWFLCWVFGTIRQDLIGCTGITMEEAIAHVNNNDNNK